MKKAIRILYIVSFWLCLAVAAVNLISVILGIISLSIFSIVFNAIWAAVAVAAAFISKKAQAEYLGGKKELTWQIIMAIVGLVALVPTVTGILAIIDLSKDSK